MRKWHQDTDYKIGTTPQTLVSLRKLGIPTPDQVVGSPAAVYYTRGDRSRVGDGSASVSWIWDVISANNLAKLLAFLEGNDWINIYIKTDFREGLKAFPRQAFKVYYGKMWKPVLTGEEGNPIARSPYSYQSVRIRFVNLVVQPGYL